MLPPKPKGCVIEETELEDGFRLSWPLPSAGVQEYLTTIPLFLFMGYFAYTSFFVFQMPGRQGVPWISVLTFLPIIFVIIPSLKLLLPSQPESITLGENSFRHNLGRAGGYRSYVDVHLNPELDRRPIWVRYFGRPLVIKADREEMGKVVLDKENANRLRYDLGADRVIVGRHLREPEKEWLAEVLRSWQRSE